MAQSAYWRPKFGGFSLLGKVPKLQALLSSIIVTSLTNYLLLTCFIVGIEPIDNWHAVFILPVVTLSNLISFTIGGLGVREGLAAALSPSMGLARGGVLSDLLFDQTDPRPRRACVDCREHEASCAAASKPRGLVRCRRPLHRELGLQAFDVSEDRNHGECAAISPEKHEAILASDVAVDR